MLVFEKEGVDYRVKFPNRCFLCFVKVSSDFEQVSYDTSAEIHFPVTDFQQVFNHLLPDNDFRFVEEAPPICAICGTLLEVLHNALNQLKSATVAVKSRISNLGKDGINREQRLQDFILDLRKIPMGLELVQEAVNLLEKIGHGPFQDVWTTWLPQQGPSERFMEETRNAQSCGGGRDLFSNDTKPENFDWQIHEELKLEEEGTRETNSESKMSFEMEDFDMQDSDDDASLQGEDAAMEEELIPPVWAQEPDVADPLSDDRAASRLTTVKGSQRLGEVSMKKRATPSRSMKVKVESSNVDRDEWMEATMEETPVSKNRTGGSKGKMQTCDFCDQEVSIESLLKHVRGHVGDYATPCPNPACKSVFSNCFSLKHHSRGTSSKCHKFIGDRLSTCETCGHNFARMRNLRRHLKAGHETSEKPFACPVSGCLASFSVRQSVHCHLNVHTKAKITNGPLPSFRACPHCGNHFPEEKFQEHLNTDHATSPDSDTKQHHIPKKKCGRPKGSLRTCDFCGERVPIGVMLKHVRGHVGDYATPCPNPNCKLVFSNICARKNHSRTSKTCCKFIEEGSSTCEICGHHAPDIPKLRVHLKADHETSEKPFSCPVSGCSEGFSVRQSVDCHLNVHTVAHITNAAPPSYQTCPVCDNHFPQDKLLEHLITVHGTPPDSIFYCKQCPNLFPSMGKLVNHLEVHVPLGKTTSCHLCPPGETVMLFPRLRLHYLAVHQVNSFDFVCEHCQQPFTRRHTFQQHLKLKHFGEPKKEAATSTDDQSSRQDLKEPCLSVTLLRYSKKSCDYCGKQVPRSDILNHLRGHVGDFVLTCPNPTCGFLSATLHRLRQHFLREGSVCAPFDTKAYSKCECCGHQASNLLSLRGHLQLVHETVDKPYSCPVANCSERFTLRQSVYCHINRHAIVTKKQKLAPPAFQTCPECEQEVPLDEVRKHLETVHQADPNLIISCKYCPYLFLSRDKLVNHLAVHINSGTPVSCDMCLEGTKYLHMIGLRSHYLTEHKVSSAREFVCDVCSKSYYTREALSTHMRTLHLGVQQTTTKLTCPECPEHEFRDEKALMVHKIRHHGADPFKCNFCGKAFDSWYSFARHEREHRGTRKVYTCDIEGCGKTLNSKKSLEYHKKSVEHVGQTNAFVCGHCGNGFNHLSSLEQHEKTVHSSERKFVCEECGESFKSGTVLRKHKLIHTGEKPFQCDICQQRFRFKEVLRRHLEGHQKKGAAFRPNGPMKNVRKRVNPK